MPLHRARRVGAPALLAALPLLVQAFRAFGHTIFFWGDQALIDLEARNSLTGKNLLGVYDRYGWHHPGPLWLQLLGVARLIGGGSASALVFGSGLIDAAAAVAVVVVAHRLRPGLTAWWAALLVVAFEWTFGAARMGTVWAPYAIALPAALLVLLVADVVRSDNPWGPTIALAVCATFLVQADISSAVVVAALVVATPVLRIALRAGHSSEGGHGLTFGTGWGWSTGRWRRGLAGLVALLGVLWLSPIIQFVSAARSNVSQVFSFMGSHSGHQPWARSVRALDTVFGSFPFGTGAPPGGKDAHEKWLVASSVWTHPWYPLYVLVTAAVLVLSLARRYRPAAATAAAALVALVAAGLSVHLVYGPLYPYLVYWMSALTVPAWLSWWLAVAPTAARVKGWLGAALDQVAAWGRSGRAAVPTACLLVVAAVTSSFGSGQLPMAGVEGNLGHNSWKTVAAAVDAPGVKTVYIDLVDGSAMPDAAAIADQAVRRGKHVEVNEASLYYLDPSFAPRSPAQLDVLVCCGRRDRALLPPGMKLQGKVGAQAIYISHQPGLYLTPVKIGRSGVDAFKHHHGSRKHPGPHFLRPSWGEVIGLVITVRHGSARADWLVSRSSGRAAPTRVTPALAALAPELGDEQVQAVPPHSH